jgi:gluconokinase
MVEDRGMASASGLFNVKDADWDAEILNLLGLERSQLPPVINRSEVVGSVTSKAASEFGLGKGTLVVAGSGDGFLANLGSGCDDSSQIAVTLGTSAVARQSLAEPVLSSSSGTFCYRADADAYLLGCAGSNGGNVLDWGHRIFGRRDDQRVSDDLPIFIPLLHGERSPEWNPSLKASWHGLAAHHTAADLSRSLLEGVIFNLAQFVEIVRMTSNKAPARLVLSGNAFLNPLAAPMLAAVTEIPTDLPQAPGLASLRGAAICALRALSLPAPPLHLDEVAPLKQPALLERYHIYRRLRASAAASF